MAYEEGKISIALFWIEKYRRYRIRFLRYKGGFIYSKYYYLPWWMGIFYNPKPSQKD